MSRTPTWKSCASVRFTGFWEQTADQTGSQIIAASHSEVVLNEAADPRRPHCLRDGRPIASMIAAAELVKSLREIGF